MNKDNLEADNIPQHIAIIMDGNRRWARSRKLPDIKGHEQGAETLEKIVEAAGKIGVKNLTVYALSTENIKERAKREVWGLFNLIKTGYQTRLKKMMQNGVRVSILGELEGWKPSVSQLGIRGILERELLVVQVLVDT